MHDQVQRLRKCRQRTREKEVLKQGLNSNLKKLVEDLLEQKQKETMMSLQKAPANIPLPQNSTLAKRAPGQLPYEPEFYRTLNQDSILS